MFTLAVTIKNAQTDWHWNVSLQKEGENTTW